ncbi:MAG TPA: signal peptidase II [Candidatus Sulfopaludibacter sp.]|jgi:signal peptidase II|nr:signal peptidase II [Candidatus Sulfopaludibacter sp.]
MASLRVKAYGAAAAVFLLDRLSKYLIETRVSESDVYKVIPGFFEIIRSENRGVAFGIFNDSTFEWRTTLLVVVSVAAVVAVSVILWNAHKLDRISLWSLALVLGGAAGNVFDRIVSGKVTDFLQVYLGTYPWPTFNVADSAIVVGSILLLFSQMKPRRQAANVP